jgi:glyoxylase-like metal-dependent hydrolase (beta-lactamase superfamily II)
MTCRFTQVIAATIIIVSAPLVAAPQLSPSPGRTEQHRPGSYRLQLGSFRVTALSDGTASRDLAQIMSKPDAVRAAFKAAGKALPVELSINCFLVDSGTQKVLVDTGAGELFGSASGQLVTNIRASGYAPEDVSAILLTHIHGDHSGGLSIGGRRVFPNALVYVDERDTDFWLNDEVERNALSSRKTTFLQSHQTVDPYVRAGKVRTFEGVMELFPGVHSVPEHGHTPGHTGYMIESRGQRLLLWGDVIHATEVQFKDPTITIEYDVDPKQAVKARRNALTTAAQQGYLVGGAHLPFPGLGHVRVAQNHYAWSPLP